MTDEGTSLDIAPLGTERIYRVLTPYDLFGASQLLLDALAEAAESC